MIIENDPNFVNIDDVAPLAGPGSNTSVPEPSGLALFATGIAALSWRRRASRRT
ncbi:MAG TPA: PEP-CTERM sorting domain-containing protein [Stellaceae bacterium]|nr:PEP-CTERM sorting domain-containing protein [Stellaceae bacterium]